MAAIQPIFTAVWNAQNIHLKEPNKALYQKILKVVWDILSIVILPIGIARTLGWAVHFVAKKLVLPSAWFYHSQIIKQSKRIFNICCRNLNQTFETQKHKIATPDGVRLNAIHFKHRQANANTPTVIFYQSNASVSQFGIYLWLVEEAVRRNSVCNFVVFDYRGVGSSRGDAQNARELLIDGETAFQYVRDCLRVPPHLIRWYCWSLGGGVGSTIKSMHPECTGLFVSERSFDSLRSVFWENIPSFLRPLFFWVPYTSEKQGWNIQAPYEKLRGPILIVYHRKDPTIPYNASAHKAALRINLTVQAIELYQTEEQIAAAQERLVDHHFELLDNYHAAPGLKADQAIANFILPPSAPVQPVQVVAAVGA